MSYQPNNRRSGAWAVLTVGGVFLIILLVGLKIGLRGALRRVDWAKVYRATQSEQSRSRDSARQHAVSRGEPDVVVQKKNLVPRPMLETEEEGELPQEPRPAQAIGRVMDKDLQARIEQERQRLQEVEAQNNATVFQLQPPLVQPEPPAPNPDAGKVNVVLGGFECTDISQVKPRDIIYIEGKVTWDRYLVQVIRGNQIQARSVQNARHVVKVTIDRIRLERDPALARVP